MDLSERFQSGSSFFSPSFWSALIVLSGAGLLSGCAFLDMKDPFGDQREPQMVNGTRHIPIYNTVDMQKIAQIKAESAPQPAPLPPLTAVAPPVSVAPVAPAVKADNYDYYDASVPKGDASSHSLGNLNPAPIRVDPGRTVRKPLAENNYPAPNNTQGNTPSSSVATIAAAPVVADGTTGVAAMDSSAHESFFSHIFGTSPANDSDKADTNPSVKRMRESGFGSISNEEKNAPSESLSSVPGAPPEFKNIKASRDQEIQALQEDHANAQAQKRELGSEPSQQLGVVQVEEPKPAKHEVSTPPAVVQSLAPVETQAPRKPQRGVDIMTQEEWNAWQKARQLQQSAPPVEPNSIPASGDAVQDNKNTDDKDKGDTSPQSALPTTPEPAAEKPVVETQQASPADTAADADEEKIHRVSYFSRLFGRSPTLAVPDNDPIATLPTPKADAAPENAASDTGNGARDPGLFSFTPDSSAVPPGQGGDAAGSPKAGEAAPASGQ